MQEYARLTLEQLMEIQVVTPTRRGSPIMGVPYAVSVITAEDIRAAGARSVPDALRLAAGVDVAQLGYGNAAVSPRGFHGFVARQVLVLVDGRQIFDSLFGGTAWGSWPLLVEDIARIEVIRGPAGVTWGANAVNGVINIVTKDPLDQLGTKLILGGGSRGSNREYVGYGEGDQSLRFRISAEHESSDGFREGGSILRRLNDDYLAGRLSAKSIYQVDAKTSLTLSAGSAVVDGGFSPPPLGGFGSRRGSGSEASFLLADWQRADEDEGLQLRGYVNDFHGSPGIRAADYRYQQIAFQLARWFNPTEYHRLIMGLDSRFDLLDATNADPFMLSKSFVSTGIVGVYLQDEWRFAEKWTLTVGPRLDYEFYGGFQPSARAALAYRLSDQQLIFGSISRAFQMPPAALRFVDLPLANGLVRVVADRDVPASPLLAYELGYRGVSSDKRLNFDANVFWHELDDLTTITPSLGPPGLIRVDLDNRASASMYGLELESSYKATDNLELVGNYAFQELEWRSEVPFHESDTTSPPEHKFMVGARYRVDDDLRLSSHLYYVDAVQSPDPTFPFLPQRIDPYFRLDLLAEYEFWNDRASFAVGVKNLLDSGHQEGGTLFLNDAEVPRMFYAELRVSVPPRP